MPAKKGSVVYEVLYELTKAVKKHGEDKTLSHLRLLSFEDDNTVEKATLDFILHLCALHYGVKQEDIIRSNKRGYVHTARTMCFVLIRNHMNVSDAEIGRFFSKTRQLVSTSIRQSPIGKKNVNNREEMDFQKDFEELSIKVVEYRNRVMNDYITSKTSEDDEQS